MNENTVVQYRGPITRPEKTNPAVPDHVWERLQDLGDLATQHLGRLLGDPRFHMFEVKDQMRVIETVLNRAYGSIDGSVRRHMHVHLDPEDTKGFNALTDLSRRAKNKLPEFSSPHSGETIDVEAEDQ